MVELQSSSDPMASASAEAEAPKRPALTTRRSSKAGGIAMSLETRLPRELLARIGINGKEVVSIIKDRDWNIEEPHGLQQQNLYYLPGAKENKEHAKQNEDFFVGEGELYAYILKQGGLRYLLPEEDLLTESEESDVEMTQPSRPTQDDAASVASASVEDCSDEMSGSYSSDSTAETTPGADQRKWKRRKKLSTARNKAAEEMETPKIPPTKRRRKAAKKTVTATEQDDQDRIRVTPKVKLEQATYGGIGQQTEFSEYESSLTARGWRAQLLQDIDVHMLRSVAAVDRRQRARGASNEGQKKSGRPTEGVGPHVQDAAEVLQELDGLTHSIRASHDDLSSMIESIIVQGERLNIPDRIDPIGRIGIPGFVSTGPGSLVLVRDIERYLLLFVAAVRRYQRARNAISANEPATGSLPIKRAVKRADLRALQLSIEESKRELQELATIVAAEAARACQEAAQGLPESSQSSSKGISQESSQGTSQSTSTTVRGDDTGA